MPGAGRCSCCGGRGNRCWPGCCYLGGLGLLGSRQVALVPPVAVPTACLQPQRVQIPLARQAALSWELSASYCRDTSQVKKVTGTTNMSGFVYGFAWHPSSVMVFEDGDSLRYAAAGYLEWRLLGIPLNNENSRVFNGTLATR